MQNPRSNDLTQRQRAVAMAVALTTNTPLAPQRYERYLLALYQRGILMIEEVVELLDLSVYQVLYHSRATKLPSESDLPALLDYSRHFNAEHQFGFEAATWYWHFVDVVWVGLFVFVYVL